MQHVDLSIVTLYRNSRAHNSQFKLCYANGTETRQLFFSYADSGKDFRKVVCPTLNEIAVDV